MSMASFRRAPISVPSWSSDNYINNIDFNCPLSANGNNPGVPPFRPPMGLPLMKVLWTDVRWVNIPIVAPLSFLPFSSNSSRSITLYLSPSSVQVIFRTQTERTVRELNKITSTVVQDHYLQILQRRPWLDHDRTCTPQQLYPQPTESEAMTNSENWLAREFCSLYSIGSPTRPLESDTDDDSTRSKKFQEFVIFRVQQQ